MLVNTFWKNSCSTFVVQLDWVNTTWVDKAKLGTVQLWSYGRFANDIKFFILALAAVRVISK